MALHVRNRRVARPLRTVAAPQGSRVRALAEGRASAASSYTPVLASCPRRPLVHRFTLRQGMADSTLRTILVSIMSTVTTLAWWGISTWVPAYVGGIAAEAGHSAASYASTAGMVYNAGAIAGYIGLGFLAGRFGRKGTVALYFAASLVMTPVLFLWTHDLALMLVLCVVNGFFTLGQYSWMPVWLPSSTRRTYGDRLRLCVQRGPLHRVPRSADRRDDHRPVQQLRHGGDRDRPRLHHWTGRGAVLPGDQRQAAAGVTVARAGAQNPWRMLSTGNAA